VGWGSGGDGVFSSILPLIDVSVNDPINDPVKDPCMTRVSGGNGAEVPPPVDPQLQASLGRVE